MQKQINNSGKYILIIFSLLLLTTPVVQANEILNTVKVPVDKVLPDILELCVYLVAIISVLKVIFTGIPALLDSKKIENAKKEIGSILSLAIIVEVIIAFFWVIVTVISLFGSIV